jgi:hypothetical protein
MLVSIMKKQKYYFLYGTLLIILFMVSGLLSQLYAQVLPGAPPDFLWAESGGGTGYDGATDITVDIAGNIIVTGYFDSTATFGNYTVQSSGSSDIYIAKYTPDGTVLWAVSAGGPDYDQPYSVITDNLGDIIITGIFNTSATFGGAGGVTLTSFGLYDIFTAKYNTNGTFQWARQGGGQSYDYGNEVATDNQNNVLVTGSFTQFATFGRFNVQTGNPYGDIFVVKYNSSGTEQWVQAPYNVTGGQSFYNSAYGVRTDNNDNVFITGSFSNVITFGDTTLVSSWDGTNADIFLAKYDAQGNFNWVVQAGSDSSGAFAVGQDISIDKNNNIIFTGTFSIMTNFGGYVLNAQENSDIFIADVNQSGIVQWAVQDHASTLYNTGEEIALDDAGNISLIATVSQDITLGELNDVYFARFSGSGQKLWGQRAGILNSNDAGGIANDSKGDIYGCGYFYAQGLYGTITLNGVNGEAFVGKIPSPKLALNPNPFDFGSIQIGTLDTATIALNNISQANLHIFNLNLVDDTSSTFGIISGFPIDSIPALQTSNMGFAFFPVYPGLKSAYMEIVSDASTSPDTLYLSGTGVLPELIVSDSVIDFGSIDVGIFSDYPLIISNLSYVNILIDSAVVRGTDASQFTLTNSVNGDTLAPFGLRTLNVRFQPDTSGLKNAYLVIYSSSPGSPDSVLLRGTGLSTIVVQLPNSPSIGQPTPLNITPPASSLFTSNNIFYKKTGDPGFQQDTLSLQGNVYTFNIPPEYSTITGIQFYVVFSDGVTTITYPSLNPSTNPASIQVNIPQINFAGTVKAGQYQMFSVPLSITAPQIDSIFNDDYGPYDPRTWRIFRWQPETSNYSEYNSISGGIVPGNSYWLINKDGRTFDVNNSLSVPAFNNYTITLQPGYNQIANPFAFAIDWLSIGNSNLILQAPIRWNADLPDYELDQTTLEPWDGYWVYNPLNTIINLDVSPNIQLGKKQSQELFSSMRDDEFLVQVKAFMNSAQAADKQNYVAMMEGASDGLDRFDVMKPPAVTEAINLSIESGKNYYARDAVPVSKDGAFWDFRVETKSPNELFNLAVDRISSLPENFSIWVLDRDREIPIDINSGSAEIVTRENGQSNFRIIVGTEEFAKIHSENISLTPYEYTLYQNYPNPFNPSTTITYQLREKSEVSLEIFDILGRRIQTIINNITQNPGQHSATWYGLNSTGEKVASGVYIYRIKANDFISTKKMILLK